MKNFFINLSKFSNSTRELFVYKKGRKKIVKNFIFKSLKFSISLFVIIGLSYSPSSPVSNVNSIEAATTRVILTSGTTWTVPADWNDSMNWIEVIGGGGRGFSVGAINGAGGGGGGAYSLSRNVNMPESTTVTISVGLGDTDAGGAGGDTYICDTLNSGGTCDAITDAAVVTGAKGGNTATSTTGATGGAAASGVADGAWGVRHSGGTGGLGNSTGETGGGGGGAGGPRGPGGTGGAGGTSTTNHGGGGGGGHGGTKVTTGTPGSVAGTTTGGAGGQGSDGTGAGTAGNGAASGGNGTAGTGAGGGGADSNAAATVGGNGATGLEWSGTHGAGGGGGGGATYQGGAGDNGGNGGLYGAGGGGGWTGGNGANGIIVITYIPAGTGLTTLFITDSPGSNVSWDVPADWNNDENFVEVIGGGGGGNDVTTNGAAGGAGGSYTLARDIALTPGGTATVRVGAGGAGTGTSGGATFFNRTAGSANTCADTVSVCAEGGASNGTTSAVLGSVRASKGELRYAGGNGGAGNNTSDSGGGGGGGAGPRGSGGAGGSGGTAVGGGGGGGGGGSGGFAGSSPGAATTGAAGAGGYTGSVGSGGTAGNGGAGGAGTAGEGDGGGGGDENFGGGAGSKDQHWDATYGSGGGGGGHGDNTTTAAAGGNGSIYGGGGGGGTAVAGALGGLGAQGMIIVTYRPFAFTISGTCDAYDQTTDCTDDGSNSIKVAYDGVLQGSSDTVVDGSWSISGLTAPTNGQVVTVFIDGASDADEAVAVTKYDGTGNIDLIRLYKEHVTIGTDTGSANSGQSLRLNEFVHYNYIDDEDIFLQSEGQGTFTCNGVTVSGFCVDPGGQSSQDKLLILPGNTFDNEYFSAGDGDLGSQLYAHDVEVEGTLTSTALLSSSTFNISGSWLDTGTFTSSNSTVNFTSTSTGETITTTGSSFYDLTFNGVGGGWTLQDNMSIANVLTITNGNLNASSRTITLTGSGTPFVNNGTFTPGTSTVIYTISNAKNITATDYHNLEVFVDEFITDTFAAGVFNIAGNLTINGNGLGATATAATNASTINVIGNVTINPGVVFIANGSNPLTIGGNFTSNGTFTHNSGTVIFNATDAGNTITGSGGITFNHLTFNGSGGGWALGGGDYYVGGNLTISAGTFKGVTSSGNLYIDGNFTGTGTGTFDSTGEYGFTTLNKPASGNINFGGAVQWTFENGIIIGDASGTGTITNTGVGAINISGGKFSLTNSTTYNAGSAEHIIGESGQTTSKPFDIQAGSTFNAQTSTVTYKGTTATDITPLTYYNLAINPLGNTTHYLVAGTYTVNNDLTLGGTNTVTINAATANPTLDVNRDFTINANATFTAPNTTFTIARNFTNSGTFTAGTGTVNFDTTATAVIAGSSSTETTFRNLTINTPAKTVQFTSTHKFGVVSGGVFTVTGDGSNQVIITSTTGDDQWIMNHQGTEALTYTTVSWSGCSTSPASTQISTDGSGNVDGGNNGTCWGFPITFSGTIYLNDEVTPDEDAGGYAVYAVVNGVTLESNGEGLSNGDWVIQFGEAPTAGDIITILMVDEVGPIAHATTVLEFGPGCSGAPGCTGIKLVHDQIRVESKNTGNTIDISELEYCNEINNCEGYGTGFSIVSISKYFQADWSTNELVVAPGTTLTASNYTYVIDKLQLDGNLSGAQSKIQLSGVGTSATCTASNSMPLCGSGTINHAYAGVDDYGFVQYQSGANTLVQSRNDYGLVLLSPQANNVTFTLGSGTLGAGLIYMDPTSTDPDSTGIIIDGSVNNPNVNIFDTAYSAMGLNGFYIGGNEGSNNELKAGSGTWTIDEENPDGQFFGNAIFTANTSTFIFTGSSDSIVPNVDGGTINYYNLQIKPGANSGTATFDSGTFNIAGNLVIGNGTNTGVVVSSGYASVDAAGDVTISANTTWALPSYINVAGNWTTTGAFTQTPNTSYFTIFDATTTGKTITTNGSVFAGLQFNGVGGGWTLGSDISVGDTLTISNGTLNASSRTITLSGASNGGGVPFEISGGTFNADTSTVAYAGVHPSSNVTVASTNYYNLTFNAAEIFNLSGATVATNHFTVTSGTVNAGAHTLTVGGNFANSGTFNADTGTVTFNDNTKTSTISGATTFNNLTVTTAGKDLEFTTSTTYAVNGILTLTGGSGGGNEITLNSTTGSSSWTINTTGLDSSNVTYTTVTWSACTVSSPTIDMSGTGNTDGGNNGDCWVFSAGISVGGTASGNDAATVRIAVNGSLAGQTTTISSNAWTITGVTAVTNDIITVWVDGVADNLESTAVTKYNGTGNITGMSLGVNEFTIGSADNQSISLSNLGLYDCDQDEDIMHSANSSALLVQGCSNSFSDEVIFLQANNTLALGTSESLTTDNFATSGTVTSTGNTAYSIGGNWLDIGTFNSGTSTVTFTSTATNNAITTSGSSFYNLTFNGVGGEWILQDNITVANVLTITNGNLNASSQTITLSGSGTPFVNNGTFNHGTSTINYVGTSATNITALNGSGSTDAYYNLHTGDVGINATYTMLGNTTVNGVFKIGYFNGFIGSNITLSLGSTTLNLKGGGTPLDKTDGGQLSAGTSTVQYTSGTGISNLSSSDMTGSNAFYNLTIDGDGGGDTFTAGVGFTTNNDLTVSSGDILASANSIFSYGAVTGDGTINQTASSFTHFTTSSKNFGGASNWTFNDITFMGSAGTSLATGVGSITINGTLAIGGEHALSAGSKTWILNGPSSPLTLNGTLDVSGGTSTFSYRNATSATVTTATYDNLDFSPASGTPTYTLSPGSLTMNNDFTIAGAGNATVSGVTNDPTIDVNGNVSIGASDVFVASDLNNMTVGGSWTNSGTFTHSSRTVTFDASTTGKTITSNTTSGPFNNITFDNASGGWTLQDNPTIAGVLTITAGNLDASSRTITLSGSGTPFVNSGTFTQGTSTVNYTGTSATNIAALNGASTTNAYYNLGLGTTSDSNSVTHTLLGNTTVNNVVTVSNAGSTGTDTLALSSHSLTLKGSGTPLNIISGKGALSAGTSTVTYASTSGTTALSSISMTGGNAFYNLVINGTGTFTAGSGFFGITAKNDLTVTSGTFSMGNSNYLLVGDSANTNSGNIKVASGASLTQTSAASLTVYSSASGSNCIGASGASCAGTAGTITLGQVTIGDWGEGGIAHTTTIGGTNPTLTIYQMVVQLNATLNAGSGTINLLSYGDSFQKHGTFVAGTSTINYSGATAGIPTNVTPTTYNNLGILPTAHSGQYIMGAGGFTVGGNFVVGNGTYVATVNGTAATTLDINGTGTSFDLKANTTFSAPSAMSVAGSWSDVGTFTHNSGTVTFDATGTGKTITSTGSSFNNVVFNGSGGGWSPSDAMVLAGDMTLTNGTLSGTQNVTVNGGDVTGNGIINMTGGTFTIDGNFATGVGGNSDWTFYNLNYGDGVSTASTDSNGSGNLTITGVMTVASDFSLNAGTKTYTLSGAGTPLVIAGVFNDESTTFKYTSGTGVTALANTALTGANAISNLEINSVGDTFNAGVAVEVKNSLLVSGGTLAMGANNLIVGNSAISDSGVIKVSSGQSLTQDASVSTTILGSASGTNCIGGGSSNCAGATGTITFGDLIIGNGTTAFTTSLNGTTPIISADTITITANAIFNAGTGRTINLTGNGTVLNPTGTFNVGASTINFNSTGTTGTTVPALTYYNLGINRASNTFTAGGNIIVGNDFTITAGTFVAPESLTINGDLSNSGTFTPNAGTVTLTPTGNNKTVNVAGSSNTTFYNLTNTTPDSILTFKAGNTYTFTNLLTLTGASGRPINLSSETGGQQWIMTLSGSSSVSYVKVKDSGCSGGNNVEASRTVRNYGNNGACWQFISSVIFQGGFDSEESATPNSVVTGGGGGGSSGPSGGGGQEDPIPASGTAVLTNNIVTGVVMTAAGAGYIIPPIVSFCGGGGSGALGTAVLEGGGVDRVNITNGGTSYETAPEVRFGTACPQGGGGGGGDEGGDSGFNYSSSNLAYAGGTGFSFWKMLKGFFTLSWW